MKEKVVYMMIVREDHKSLHMIYEQILKKRLLSLLINILCKKGNKDYNIYNKVELTNSSYEILKRASTRSKNSI